MKNFIGEKAIDFTLPAVLSNGSLVNEFNFYSSINKKYSLLFFYPMDFTYVCPSELLAINNRLSEFKKRNVQVIAISIDSHFVHKAWRETPLNLGGVGKVGYPLVSDIKREVIKFYNLEDKDTGVSYRSSFVIDELKVIRIQHIHDLPIGRNIDEYIRLFDALTFYNKRGNLCQAGWLKGSDGIAPSSKGVSDFLTSNSEIL